MTRKLKGIGASPGIVLGKTLVLHDVDLTYEREQIPAENISQEIERLNNAVQTSIDQLDLIYTKALQTLGAEDAEILQAHQMLLMDPEFIGKMIQRVESEHSTAPAAVDATVQELVETFLALEDDYLRERAADMRDIGRRLLANLLGVELNPLEHLTAPVIIVAHELTPSQTALMDKTQVLGFITETGGRTSHTAIMARTLEIPAVLGLSNITKLLQDGTKVIVDGEAGLVYLEPVEEEIALYMDKLHKYKEDLLQLMKLTDALAVTLDGRQIELAANIGSPADVPAAVKYGAEGVGLFRTEFLYMDRPVAPTEEEQFLAYRQVLEAFRGKPVIIRTLDIGGDKALPYLEIPPEMNPFMGWRAIRFCLERRDIFKTQLRALLRASFYGNLHIMYPFISGLQDLRAANALLREVQSELAAENIVINPAPKVGIMIEVPSAALIADQLAREVDFFSIGTNDLIQYTLAADRMNEKVSSYYDPFHPAVLRLIKLIVEGGHKAGIPVGMCGEMAGDPAATEVLLGLGLDELSMSAGSLLKVKQVVRSLNSVECIESAERMLL